MASFSEWSNKKKKEREEAAAAGGAGSAASGKLSFSEWSNQKHGASDREILARSSQAASDESKNAARNLQAAALDAVLTKKTLDDLRGGTAALLEDAGRGGGFGTVRSGGFSGNTIRDADLYDLTVGSVKRGYENAQYGREAYKAMQGWDNQMDEYAEKLASDAYNFETKNWVEKGVSGAAELLGQQIRQWTDPTTLAAAGAGATTAFIAGQMGPQALLPEEVLTVPGAAAIGFKLGSAKANMEIEAGHSYLELLENGVSEDTAQVIASLVGGGNAALEALQLDELFKSFKVLDKMGADDSILKIIAKELGARGLDVTKETLQEVGQEGVTIAGTQAGSMIDKGEWAYSADEVAKRLGDTALSSALSFGFMNVPGGVSNVVRQNAANQTANKTQEPDAILRQAEEAAQTTGDPAVDAALRRTAEEMAQEYVSGRREAAGERTNVSEGVYTSGTGNAAERAAEGYREGAQTETEQIGGEEARSLAAQKEKTLRRNTFLAAKSTLGEEGYAAFEKNFGRDTTYADLTRAYNDGLANRKSESKLSSVQYNAMFEAGRADAKASVQAQADMARNAVTYKGDSGIDYADADTKAYVEASVDKKTAKAINTVAKALGIKVRFADSVSGGDANAEIANGVVTIEKGNPNPLRRIFGHEITHRMQELAPAEYARLREAVATGGWIDAAVKQIQDNYARHGRTISSDAAMDEAVADYVGSMLEDSGELERFIERHRSDRTLLEKLRDVIRDLAQKLRGTDRYDGLSDVERRLSEALDKSVKQAKKNAKAQKNTTNEGGVQHNLKEYTPIREKMAKAMLDKISDLLGEQFPLSARFGAYIKNTNDVVSSPTVTAGSVQLNGRSYYKAAKDEFINNYKKDEKVAVAGSGIVAEMDTNVTNESMSKRINRGDEQVLLDIIPHAKSMIEGGKILGIERIQHTDNKPSGLFAYRVYNAFDYVSIDPQTKTAATTPYVFVATVVQQYDGNSIVHAIRGIDIATYDRGKLGKSEESSATTGGNYNVAQLYKFVKHIPREDGGLKYSADNANDYLFRYAKKDDGTKYSLKTKKVTSEEAKANDKKALEHFGRTYKWAETGYVLLDGSKLDFSGKHEGGSGGYRTVDHRDISDALGENYGGDDYSGGMVQFMSEGNIRIMPESGGINLSVKPTKAQLDALSDFISKNRGEVILDIDDLEGNTLSSTEYPRGTHANKVLGDIKKYFDTGEAPHVSELAQFRYSLKGSEELGREIERIIRDGKRNKRSDADIQADIRAAVDEVYQGMIEDYGAMEPGERPFRDAQVPRRSSDEKKVSQTVRTILEAQATPDEVIPDIERLVASGDFSYDVYTDKQALEDARSSIVRTGWEKSQREWFSKMEKGEVSKELTTKGWVLYNNAANTGDTELALDILGAMVKHQRNAAQALQATRILKKLSPETQLYQVRRSVDGLQEELNQRYGKKGAPELKIDQTLAEQYMKAETQEQRDVIMKDIYRDIGRQMPSTFRDKWNAWRYLAMLGNFRTHVRNVVGNLGFAPVVGVKNIAATAIESAVSRLSGGKLERTKSAIGFSKKDRSLLSAAWKDYAIVEEAAMGGGKYDDMANANKYIEEGRKIFKNKALEAVRRGNSKAMDVEDQWFSQPHYAAALAGYCKAHGITAEQIASGNNMKDARAYALKEAQKATYRDTNALSQTISELGRVRKDEKNPVKKGVGLVMEGILPFRKTPANILARGLEYSPLGLLNGIKQAIFDVKSEKKTGAEAIDRISAGLTGTGLLALGLYLAAQGLVRGHGSGDEKEKEYEELMGHQAYALELPDGTSVTLDWLAPEVLPFFIGVNLWEQTEGKAEELTLSTMLNAVKTVSEPLLEMSCLQSLNDVFDAVGYATSDGLEGLPAALASAGTSYLTQALPTLLGQAERTGEGQRMTTYTEKNAFLTGDMQYTLGRASARLPLWDYQQIPYIDAWGRTESSGGVGTRAFNNFANPAYTSKVEASETENELLRLYEATGEGSVLPSRAAKYFKVSGERKDLTAEEYVKYATKKGQTAYELMEALTKTSAYKAMDDAEKVEAVEAVYTYANAVAKTAVSNYKPEGWVAKAIKTSKATGIKTEQYVTLYLAQKGIESLKDANGETIDNSAGLQIMELIYNTKGLTEKQRLALFEDFGVGKTVRHFNQTLVANKLKQMRKQAK